MKRLLLALALALSALCGGEARATTCTVPNTFVNGTVADGGQVTANFTALLGCITNFGSAGLTISGGDLVLNGANSGAITIHPQANAGLYNFNLPTTAGTSGQALLSGGGGLAPMTFGTLGVSGGGTGLGSGVSGGIPAYTGTTTLASSNLLTQHALVIGGGAGATPYALGSLGTGTTVLHGNATGDPSFALITNADLMNTTITIGTTSISLGGTSLTLAGLTSINKVAITAPATSATLTVADGKTLTASNSLTLSGTDAKALVLTTGLTVAGNDGTLSFGAAGKTVAFNNTMTFAGTDAQTYTMPAASDTMVGRASVDTLTNKTFDTAGAGNVFKINTTAISAVTGTGSAVLATSPTLVTPALGVATATSINGLAITASTGTLAITNGKTFSVSNTITLSGTDATTMTFPTTNKTLLATDFSNVGANKLPLANGGTNADLSATGAASNVLKQVGAGAAVTVGRLACADLSDAATGCSAGIAIGQIPGTTTNDDATAGNVGEILTATLASGSAQTPVSAATTDVTSIALTAGDWDVQATCWFKGNVATTVSNLLCGISTTSGTLPATGSDDYGAVVGAGAALFNYGTDVTVKAGSTRETLAGATTVYAVARATYAVNTLGIYGQIRARRVR